VRPDAGDGAAGAGRRPRSRLGGISASPHDKEILRFAVPAFGALVAEPLFLLADSAIVGWLGTVPLGGLGVASQALTTLVSISIFLAYGTTAAVARQLSAGNRRGAPRWPDRTLARLQPVAGREIRDAHPACPGKRVAGARTRAALRARDRSRPPPASRRSRIPVRHQAFGRPGLPVAASIRMCVRMKATRSPFSSGRLMTSPRRTSALRPPRA
jgi:MatE